MNSKHQYGKPQFTDTVNPKTTLIIKAIVDKKPEDYHKKYCHPHMADKNYPIAFTTTVNPTILKEIKEGNQDQLEKIKDELRRMGMKGDFVVQEALGGPGQRGKYETKEEWLSKRRSGMPQIAQLKVD